MTYEQGIAAGMRRAAKKAYADAAAIVAQKRDETDSPNARFCLSQAYDAILAAGEERG